MPDFLYLAMKRPLRLCSSYAGLRRKILLKRQPKGVGRGWVLVPEGASGVWMKFEFETKTGHVRTSPTTVAHAACTAPLQDSGSYPHHPHPHTQRARNMFMLFLVHTIYIVRAILESLVAAFGPR